MKSNVLTPFSSDSYNNILSPQLFDMMLNEYGTKRKSELDLSLTVVKKDSNDSINFIFEEDKEIEKEKSIAKEKEKILSVKKVPKNEVTFGLDLNCFINLIMSSDLRVRPRSQSKHAYSV